MTIDKKLKDELMNGSIIRERVDPLSGRKYNPIDITEEHMLLDCVDKEVRIKFNIYKNQERLSDIIENYQDIYSAEEDEDFPCNSSEEAVRNRERLLVGLEGEYLHVLNNLKFLGADVSEYPKSLEEMTK